MNNENLPLQKTEATSSVISSPRRIKIYSSFEESRQDKINYIINQSPTERLRQTVELILRAYNVTRESLKEKKYSNRIKIVKSQFPIMKEKAYIEELQKIQNSK